MEQNDQLHSQIQSILIKHIKEKRWNLKVYAEYPYNNFGDRGFIDVLEISNDGHCFIYEIKTHLKNLGESLRQLNKAEVVLKKESLGRIYHKDLLVVYSEENLEILRRCYDLFSTSNIRLKWMFCFMTDEDWLMYHYFGKKIDCDNYHINKSFQTGDFHGLVNQTKYILEKRNKVDGLKGFF